MRPTAPASSCRPTHRCDALGATRVLHDSRNDLLALAADAAPARDRLDNDVGHRAQRLLAVPVVAGLVIHRESDFGVARLAHLSELPVVGAVVARLSGHGAVRTVLPSVLRLLQEIVGFLPRRKQHNRLFYPVLLVITGFTNDLVAHRLPAATFISLLLGSEHHAKALDPVDDV